MNCDLQEISLSSLSVFEPSGFVSGEQEYNINFNYERTSLL